VDGQTISVHVPGDNKPIEIKVEPDRPHKLRIRKDGFVAFTQDVELQSGKSAPIRVRLEPVKIAAGKPAETQPAGQNKGEGGGVTVRKDREEVAPEPLDCTGEGGLTAEQVKRVQQAWARHLGRQVEEEVEVAGGVKMTFVLVPPGKFLMGSPEGEEGRGSDETLHRVTLTRPFYLGKYEVTQKQYEALIGTNPSQFKGEDRPVEQVSWEEVRGYAERLTKKRADGHVYRLPTEAEWEYSCRGGRPSSQPFGIGNGRTLSSRQANFIGNFPYGGADRGPYLKSTCAVGSYTANALGLFDMHGNVWEWCQDRYGKYPQEDVTNPVGPSEGSNRVGRGGCWNYGGRHCRSAIRNGSESGDRLSSVGFRLARSLPSGGK
jgi:formylglycine-generating enzyme required for sulfatase activity